jgi:hypothetical protein
MVHAWERVFGVLCYENGQKVVGTIEAMDRYLSHSLQFLPPDRETPFKKSLCIFTCSGLDNNAQRMIQEISLFHDEVHILCPLDISLLKTFKCVVKCFKSVQTSEPARHYFHIQDNLKDLDKFGRITFATDRALLLGSLAEGFKKGIYALENGMELWGFLDSYNGSLHCSKGLHHLVSCYPRIFSSRAVQVYYQYMKNCSVEKMLSSPYCEPDFQKYFTLSGTIEQLPYQYHYFQRVDIDICCTIQKLGWGMDSMVKVSDMSKNLCIDIENDFELLPFHGFPLINKSIFVHPVKVSPNSITTTI